MPIRGLNVSGKKIARLFGEETERTLGENDFKELQHFLSKSPERQDSGTVGDTILARLQIFFAAEILESGEPMNRLGAPSGPENTEMGLVMHCQSKEGEVGEFFDIESRSIQTLAEKGLSNDYVFGFDWHWRGETSARGRGPCPATQWTKNQRDLHNALSRDILEILPLPLLLVAGSCAKEQSRKTLSSRARKIELVVKPSSSIEIDLDFRPDGLRRITAYMDYPSASFFRPNSAEQRSVCHASLDFFLWLTGKSCNPTTFSQTQRGHQRGVPRSAPPKELREYVRLEKGLDRGLEKQKYEPSFWTWAHGFLKEDLGREDSVAGTIRDEIHSRIRITNLGAEQSATRAKLNRQLNVSRYGYAIRVYWHGEAVRVPKNGDFRICVFADRPALLLRLGKTFLSKTLAYGSTIVIVFSEIGLALKIGEHVVYKKSRKLLLCLKHEVELVKQLDREVIHERLKSRGKGQ